MILKRGVSAAGFKFHFRIHWHIC